MKQLPYQTHADVLTALSNEISALFESLGAIAPPLSELYASERWRYCQTENKKARGKIGFLCHHEWHH